MTGVTFRRELSLGDLDTLNDKTHEISQKAALLVLLAEGQASGNADQELTDEAWRGIERLCRDVWAASDQIYSLVNPESEGGK